MRIRWHFKYVFLRKTEEKKSEIQDSEVDGEVEWWTEWWKIEDGLFHKSGVEWKIICQTILDQKWQRRKLKAMPNKTSYKDVFNHLIVNFELRFNAMHLVFEYFFVNQTTILLHHIFHVEMPATARRKRPGWRVGACLMPERMHKGHTLLGPL